MERTELERLTSQQLHDRAIEVARRRFDLGFVWKLAKAVPVAHAAEGNVAEADADIASLTALLADVVHSGEGDVADGLRPLYIDYLEEHS